MGQDSDSFATQFHALTARPPLPWQRRWHDALAGGDFDAIKTCALPTGLGKTMVIALWLIALANDKRDRVPRRLVYVVNRRTVVDQTTDEVEKLRGRLMASPLADRLRQRCRIESSQEASPLAISTLRGQFADNREWSANPSRPAVICGTVDMIGSRLLFNGYGVGFKARPLHAGFLGQDALLIHDEAHLEPAFQTLIEAIQKEQVRSDLKPLRVVELTATSRSNGQSFLLTEDDYINETVLARIRAAKKLYLEALADPKKLADQVAMRALQFRDSGLAVLIFVRTVEDVLKVRDALVKAKQSVETLTGTLRGKERDELVETPTFQRFLRKPSKDGALGTVYLVCTSAGEVGINISADHLVCDLSTFESMAQRFGRVNRFGDRTDTEIHVIFSTDTRNADYAQRLEKTLALLRQLKGNGSPDALSSLPLEERSAAFAPSPTILPSSDILFDAWALTSIQGKLPGRPAVEPYLHGLPTEWQPPETYVAWRQEVEAIPAEVLDARGCAQLLSEYPLKPHELLREPSYRAFEQFAKMAKRLERNDVPVWLLDDDGSVERRTLADLADKANRDEIDGKTVILPPSAGGLSGGMLDGTADAPVEGSLDVADDWSIDGIRQRIRVWNDEAERDTAAMHEVFSIRVSSSDEGDEEDVWRWLRLTNEGDRGSKQAVEWAVHVGDVEREVARIVDALPLADGLKWALKLAAKFHDHGKRRALFQRVLGNTDYQRPLAKSGRGNGNALKTDFRHEFGSLFDIEKDFGEAGAAAAGMSEHWELVLHLIAAHHGRARPHFPLAEVFDPDYSQVEAERIATEVPRRFGRLQRKYGRWGLAYLESLLRAADWAASSNPSAFAEDRE